MTSFPHRRDASSTYLDRMVIDGLDRELWLAARGGNIGGSDAAKYAKLASAPLYLRAQLDAGFTGNKYTTHGSNREAAIMAAFNFPRNVALFHADGNRRHVSTPDGVMTGTSGEVVIAECKTTSKPFRTIPPAYIRQCQWNMYVMGASRTLFMWEEHAEFSPLAMEPESLWIDRDDSAIATLIEIADYVIAGMDSFTQFENEMRMK